MAFDFPSSPTDGQVFTPTAGISYKFDGIAWNREGADPSDVFTKAESDTRFVFKTGDVMTGLLLLSGDPSVALGAATKQYVDAQSDFLIGDTRPIGQGVPGDIFLDTTTGCVYGPRLVSSSAMFAYPNVISPNFDNVVSNYEMGISFRPSVDCILYGIRYYRNAAYVSTQHYVALWNRSTQAQIVRELHTGDPAGEGWVLHTLSTPIPLTAGTDYIASWSIIGEGYPYGGAAWPQTIDGVLYSDGCYTGTVNACPTTFSASSYSVEPQIGPDEAAAWPLAVDLALQTDVGAGGVTSVTGTAPVVSSGGATPAISMPAATTSVNGHLTSADWNTFNGKANATHTHTQSDVTSLVSDLALKAPLASPVFTGDPTAPTPATADNDTSIATTAFVKAQGYVTSSGVTSVTGTAPVVSSGGTTPAISMAAAGASVDGYLTSSDWTVFNSKAPLANPVFTGDPQAPTPVTADNDTSIATTAFVKAQGYVTTAQADGNYVNKVGSQSMQGPLWIDTDLGVNVNLNISGNTTLYGPLYVENTSEFNANTTFNGVANTIMGALTLGGDPTSALHAATKQYVDNTVAGGAYLPLTGGTLTGTLSLVPASGFSTLSLNKASKIAPGDNTQIVAYAGGNGVAANLRWTIRFTQAAESTGNAGSDFYLNSYDDAGALIGSALTITRSTALATVKGDPTAALGIATKQYADTKVSATGNASIGGELTVTSGTYGSIKLGHTGSGGANNIYGSEDGAYLWQIQMPEATSNDFVILRYNPAGTFADIPFRISQATGNTTFIGAVGVGGNAPAGMINGGMHVTSHINSGNHAMNAYYDGAWKANVAGWASFISMPVADGRIIFYRSNASMAAGAALTLATPLIIDAAGTGTFSGNVVADNVVTGNVWSPNATTSTNISGGSAANSGGNIELYGQSHATLASRNYYDSALHTFRDMANTVIMTADTGAVSVTGTLTSSGGLTGASVWAQGGVFQSGATAAYFCGNGGDILLRPMGSGSSSNQTSIDSATGNMTVNGALTAVGTVSSNQSFASTSAAVILAPTGAGTCYLRPNGAGSATGQAWLGSDGVFHIVAAYQTSVNGINIQEGLIQTSKNTAAAAQHYTFANTNGAVGFINTSASSTQFGTTSDETLKDFIGPYDPLIAIDIIRRDPVRDFHWKKTGEYAVGWGAQTSYEISKDLAVPPPENMPNAPWGVDQGKRTPYLWAALAWALDRIDELTSRVAALEAA
jgi:hypothetical protein